MGFVLYYAILSLFIYIIVIGLRWYSLYSVVYSGLADLCQILNYFSGTSLVAAGIVLFLLVERVVRYVEENSGEATSWGHGHHHHHSKSTKKLKDDSDICAEKEPESSSEKEKVSDEISQETSNGDEVMETKSHIRKVS